MTDIYVSFQSSEQKFKAKAVSIIYKGDLQFCIWTSCDDYDGF